MPRYAAFLRGIMPTNCRMSDLKAACEAAGFTDVKTVLASGNVVFTANKASNAALEQKVEAAIMQRLGRTFMTIVRSVDELREMQAADPYSKFRLPSDAKRVVTFLRTPSKSLPKLPVERDGARILAANADAVFTAYVRHPKGAVFMQILEQTFGKDITTRTWDTIAKVAR